MQPRMRLVLQPLLESRKQARFPDPRLARQQYYLTVSCFRPAPTPPQQFEFVLTANKRRQCRRSQCLETVIDTARAKHLPDLHRFSETFKPRCAQIAKLEQLAEQAASAHGNDDCIRLGEGLQPRGKVRCLANDRLLLRRAFANQIANDYEPGGDADARLQLDEFDVET